MNTLLKLPQAPSPHTVHYKRNTTSRPLFSPFDTPYLCLATHPHEIAQMRYQRPEIMLIKHSRSKKPVKIMDPDCAICSQPAIAQCECEAKGLDIAVRQAEQRMMTSVFTDIR
jgi:hypothetical protein